MILRQRISNLRVFKFDTNFSTWPWSGRVNQTISKSIFNNKSDRFSLLIDRFLKCCLKPFGWSSGANGLRHHQINLKSIEFSANKIARRIQLKFGGGGGGGGGSSNSRRSVLWSTPLAALSSIFTWDEHKISDDDIRCEVDEILSMFTMEKRSVEEEASPTRKNRIHIDLDKSRGYEDEEWKLIFDKPDLIIWRREIMLNDTDLSAHAGKLN